MSQRSTRTRILDTAERLFAEQGFSDVSLRQIITAARVNLAAVHYHFGSRQSLIAAVLERRIAPLNEERLRLLDHAQRRSRRSSPPVTALLEALIAPPLRHSRDPKQGGVFMRLIGHALSDPNPALQQLLLRQMQPVVDRFNPAFQRALPHLPLPKLFWRIHFTVGAMAHTMTHSHHLEIMSRGRCKTHDVESILRQLVAFAAAGLKAPAQEEGRA